MVDGAPATDSVTFTNAMRSATFSNSSFYKSASEPTIDVNDLERHRIWLDLVNNATSQSDRALVGYVEGATNNADSFYDAETMYMGSMALFSMIGNEKYLIQGRQLPFNTSDVIPLGVTITAAGRYTIGIGAFDGLFTNPLTAIYLEDKVTEKVQNLKIKPYTFSANAGTFTNRFKLRFKYKKDDDDKTVSTAAVLAFKANTDIEVTTTESTMESITVFDLVGRVLFTINDLHGNHFTIPNIVLNQQALILKVTMTDGSVVTKKML
jgi:hypothetical protein